MAQRNFCSALREADTVFGRMGIPKDRERRIEQRLRLAAGDRSEFFRGMWFWAVAGACLALVVVSLSLGALRSGASVDRLGDLEVTQPTADWSGRVGADSTLEVVKGGCSVVSQQRGISLAVSGPTALRLEAEGIRLLHGRADVVVQKRSASAGPARVLVSGGAIEVLGTRYIVEQWEGGGSVQLLEGSIRFMSADGRATLLVSGQTLQWPVVVQENGSSSGGEGIRQVVSTEPSSGDAPEIRAPSSSTRSGPVASDAPKSAAPQPVDTASILRQVAVLRSRRQYESAVALLRETLRQEIGAGTRERLEYELGEILTYQVGDRQRACEHWQRVGSDSGSRYSEEVNSARKRLKCDQP